MKTIKYILLFILLNTDSLSACMCESIVLDEYHWEVPDEIFLGKLIKEERIELKIYPSSNDSIIVSAIVSHFEILNKWKGSNSNEIKITQIGSSCTYDYYIDNFNYLITASNRRFNYGMDDERNPELMTNDACSLIFHERIDEEQFNMAKSILDQKFPKPIKLNSRQGTNPNNDKIFSYLPWMFGIAIGFIMKFALDQMRNKWSNNR